MAETLRNAFEGRAQLRSAHLHVRHGDQARAALDDDVDETVATLRSRTHRESGAAARVGGSKPAFECVGAAFGDSGNARTVGDADAARLAHVDAPRRRLA